MEYVTVLLPSIGVGLLFWYVIRSVVRADSIERREMNRFYSAPEDTELQADAGEPVEASTTRKDSADGPRDETGADR